MKFVGACSRTPHKDRLAQLLNLTREEYHQLSHSDIKTVHGLSGSPLYHYIIISPLNPENILSKINMDQRRMVYFPPEAFERYDYTQDEAV